MKKGAEPGLGGPQPDALLGDEKPDERPLKTPGEVADMLRVSKAWILDHAAGRRRPTLPSVKLGRAVRFEPRAVEQFIIECRRLVGQYRKGHASA